VVGPVIVYSPGSVRNRSFNITSENVTRILPCVSSRLDATTFGFGAVAVKWLVNE
jgi:hypothetical protein